MSLCWISNVSTIFSDSAKEKHIRGVLKSEVLRLVGSDNLVILDGLNYIKGLFFFCCVQWLPNNIFILDFKNVHIYVHICLIRKFLKIGFRYELYCGSKANKSTQCTVHTEINRDEAWRFNENRTNSDEKYDRETFDALVARYENPDGRNRWDAPLFMVFPTDELNKESVYNCLFNKAPPPPNMSTQNVSMYAEIYRGFNSSLLGTFKFYQFLVWLGPGYETDSGQFNKNEEDGRYRDGENTRFWGP